MAYTYNTWFAGVFNAVGVVSTATPINPLGTLSSYTDPYWVLELPNIIDAGEQRCFRDLDLLDWRVTDATGTLTAAQRTFTLPMVGGTFRRVEQLNVLTTSSDASPATVRTVLIPNSRALLDMAWPSNSTFQGVPQVFAMRDNRTVLLGPSPDSNYSMEVIGPQTPAPLSQSNQTTFLSIMYPDLFWAATMIRVAAFMRDLGSMAENPMMSVNWQGQYDMLLKGSNMEEAARWYRSQGWTAQVPQSVTTPPRV